MRRIVIAIITTLLSISSFAQLNVQQKNDKVEKIATLRSTYADLVAQGSTYYLLIRTSNQFDRGCEFCLGLTGESAIQTAKDMIDLAESLEKNESVNVTDALGVGALLVKKTMVGKPYLDIHSDKCAGVSNIAPQELQKAIDKIKERENVK